VRGCARRPADFVLHNIYRCFARRRFDPFARRKLVPRGKWKKKTTPTLNYCTRRLIIYIYIMRVYILFIIIITAFYFSEHARSLRAAAILSARPLTPPPPPFPPNTARPGGSGRSPNYRLGAAACLPESGCEYVLALLFFFIFFLFSRNRDSVGARPRRRGPTVV